MAGEAQMFGGLRFTMNDLKGSNVMEVFQMFKQVFVSGNANVEQQLATTILDGVESLLQVVEAACRLAEQSVQLQDELAQGANPGDRIGAEGPMAPSASRVIVMGDRQL